MTSSAPTRPARNCQVSSHIANDDNSVGLSAAAQSLFSENCKDETDSDSDKESDSPTVVAESVLLNTIVSAPAVGEEPSNSIIVKSGQQRQGKKKGFPSDTTFVVDPDINLRSAGLKELLSDEPSAPKIRAAVVIAVFALKALNQVWPAFMAL
ncbi:hypothetical protein K438DRAFT_1751317 [Mycena galopus ATCC 62051]|nr:hypothetical protein K438DRAFT_1751317 [Mycena galopus ATCC 62051]